LTTPRRPATRKRSRFARETHLAGSLALVEAEFGVPLDALEYSVVVIRRYHDAGNTANMCPALSVVAILFHRLARHESAATIAGFASNSMAAVAIPAFGTAITHLLDLVGDETYEALARKGETMSTAEMVACAYTQIDEARAELKAVSK
jgi:hypothetical protein